MNYSVAKMREAENCRMPNPLRNQPKNGICCALRLLRGRIGRALISLGERVEDHQLPSAT
jgi:hypothetical protein